MDVLKIGVDDAADGFQDEPYDGEGDVGGRGGGAAAVDAVRLMRRLRDADARERRVAVRALARLPAHTAPQAAAIAVCVDDPGYAVRLEALAALGRMGEHAAAHAAVVAARLDDPRDEV